MIITENLKNIEEQDAFLFDEVIIKNTYNVKKEEIENKVIIDIGANIGLFSIFCAENGAKKVIAIEASSNIFKKLKENTKEYNNIEIINLAVYKEDDKEIYIKDDKTCSIITKDTNSLKVKTITLESIINKFSLQNIENIVLKLDCEGAEHDILLNTKKEILEKIETIYIEMHEKGSSYDNNHDNKKLKKYIENLGFETKYKYSDIFSWEQNEKKEKFNIKKMPVETYKMKKIEISIIIPTYNHLEDCLKPCLESIIEYTILDNIEIIIVANGCNDGTKKYVKSLGEPFKLIWFDEPLGYITPTNEGIKKSFGKFIILLNNDTILLHQNKNDWIKFLIDPLKDKSVGVVGPEKMQFKTKIIDKSFILFFCAAIRKELFDELGLLDEIFSPGYCEDIDFCFKAENASYKNIEICKNCFPIYHKHQVTFSEEKRNVFSNANILLERYEK